jgi:hypothetical protein
MIGTVARRPRSPVAVLAATLAATASAALLAGCAGGGGGGTAAATSTSSSSSAAASSSGSVSGSKLTKGLLPADAFGTQATVIGLTLEQLKQNTSALGAGSTAGLQVDPPSCAAAVQGTSPNYDQVKDLAAQSALSTGGATVEALMTGGPATGAAEKLGGAAAACPQATLTLPQSGQATITFTTVQIKDMGDDTAALQMTTSLTKPDGTRASVPALIGAVEDSDRLLLLITAGTNGAAPDQASFTSLLEKAYSTEHAALK